MRNLSGFKEIVEAMPEWAVRIDRYCKQKASKDIAITTAAGLMFHPVNHLPIQATTSNLNAIVHQSDLFIPKKAIHPSLQGAHKAPLLLALINQSSHHNKTITEKILDGLGFIPDNIKTLQNVIEFLKGKMPKDLKSERQKKLLEGFLEPTRHLI